MLAPRILVRGALVLGLALAAVAPHGLAFEKELPSIAPAPMTASTNWPAATNVTRPWTRWWWLGSAVNAKTLTRLLETYRAAGLGGVEITALYGIRGVEDREIPYLSPEWVELVRHCVREGKRLDMQVDLPTGSGWRTGGPSVTEADQNTELALSNESIDGGATFTRSFDGRPPQALVAYGENGEVVDLSEQAQTDVPLEWNVPPGKWTLYTATERWSKDNVKRAAPGGEGRNINPLSRRSLENFLAYFEKSLGDAPQEGIRAQFHDSYEYEGNWCDDFFDQFEKRRGYKLQEHLPELDGKGNPDDVARVKHDYRETVSDLVLDNLIVPWTAWSHENGMLSRNQSHGSPANWLDLYEACDIPEIESFGRLVGGDTNRLVFMFAPSAAHVAGKPLVSAESATWIEEHFHETLGQVKEVLDRLFLAGVNHVVYHGTVYSPDDVAWPGWLFYASAQLGPHNPLWRDFQALNEYVTRCQSVLQSTEPDNDILLYWPLHDFWHNPDGLRMNIQVHNSRDWLDKTEFGRVAKWLDEHGYKFDYISDRQLAKCKVADGEIETSGGARYAILLVPGAKFLPIDTGRNITRLAEEGATVVSSGRRPQGTPGWKHRDEQQEFDTLSAKFVTHMEPATGYAIAKLGKGRIAIADNLTTTLPALGVRGERWSSGDRLRFHRRAWSGGNVYFIKNDSDRPFDDTIAPQVEFQSALVMNPLDGEIGAAEVITNDAGNPSIRLQMAPHQALIVKTYREWVKEAQWRYVEPAGEATPLDVEWKVEFIAGGPELPPPYTTRLLESWTTTAGSAAESFAGTARYSTTFTPDTRAKKYALNLGHVADSARVELNGKLVGTLFAPPFEVEIGPLSDGPNRLTIEVTNVAANRIRDLDRRGVQWKNFKDINFVDIQYRPFDASQWPVRDAGLLGPVTVTPLAQ